MTAVPAPARQASDGSEKEVSQLLLLLLLKMVLVLVLVLELEVEVAVAAAPEPESAHCWAPQTDSARWAMIGRKIR